MEMESIQDILHILYRQLEKDIYAEDGQRRVLLVKDLYHQKARKHNLGAAA
jgi:hypothetical protein